MIGSTMPVSNLHGDAPIAMADKMRDFLKANPKVTLITFLLQMTQMKCCGCSVLWSPGIMP